MRKPVRFALAFPVWAVVGSPKGDPNASGFSWDGALTGEVRGRRALLTFSDDDLLERFLSAHPQDADLEPVAFTNPWMFIAFLWAVEGEGVATHVAIDPWYDKVLVYPSLRVFIDSLVERIPAQMPEVA